MTHFSDDFESGTLASWPTQTGNVSASTAAAWTGSYGARVSPGGGVAGQFATSTTKWTQGSLTWAHLHARFRINTLPVGTSADLFTLQAQTAVDNFDFFYNQTTGTFQWDLKGLTAFADTGVVPQIGKWYELQALIFYGATTYTAEVMLDGVNYGVLSSPGEASSFVRSLHIGTSSTTKTYEFDVDNVVINVGTSEPEFLEYRNMSKQSGLGDRLFVAGYNLSGDIGSLGRIGGGPAAMEVTGIDKSAMERIGGLRDGGLEFSSWFNDAAGQAHPRLSALPTSDVILTYCRGTTLGNAGAAMVAKQANYDGSRGADGAFTFSVNAQANAYGLEWGVQGTAGIRTDTAATNGSSVDGVAATSFGLQAYLHVFSFTGTSVTVKLQQSSDNGAGDAWADVTGGAFTAATGITSERIATAGDQAVERYLRVVTTGTFTDAQFAVLICRNPVATVF